MALSLNWAAIVAVCAVLFAITRLVGQWVDDAERRESRRQWQLMCASLELIDLTDDPSERSIPSPTGLRELPARESVPTLV